jgi:hypothetical protein
VAVVLGFVLHLRGKGLWIGILAGTTVQATLLALVTAFTNWQKQVVNLCKVVVYFLFLFVGIFSTKCLICYHIMFYNVLNWNDISKTLSLSCKKVEIGFLYYKKI